MDANLIALIAIFVTMILGFIGVFVMIQQMSSQLRTELKSDISELKEDLNRLENRFESDIKELRGLILGLYSPRLIDKIDKQDAA